MHEIGGFILQAAEEDFRSLQDFGSLAPHFGHDRPGRFLDNHGSRELQISISL
jgi:hypothetical protein